IIIMRSQKTNVMVDKDTTFYLLVTDNKNCYNVDSMDVSTIPKPILKISDTTACQGQTVTIRAIPTNPVTVGGFIPKYSWLKNGFKMPDTTDFIRITTAGSYTGNYRYGQCAATGTAVISFKNSPLTDMADDVKFCKEAQGAVTLDAGPGDYYSWLNTTDSTRYLTVTQPMYYYVKVFNSNNCFTVDSVNVRNVCPPKIFVPKAFTPEIAGDNNLFKIFGTSLNNFRLTIFNRWGEIIYFTEDREKFWDGIYKGELMPMGVYPWTITYEDFSEDSPKKVLMKGSVTVLR
ncbi:MAG TPA: gliding motility-associated C-terminal domain-containing protein, partial [Cytophagaceae bacterium]